MAVSSTSDLTTALEDLTYGTTERKVNQRGSSELGKDEFFKTFSDSASESGSVKSTG